ncbi:mannan endo-1,6-alpha-mannosidase [Wilcoxina mikolae CBS 423.85]|nr:mannan endo-1,6-alpha-mannosidase [Wilcoxina mikolae CBS 423.85]
MMQFYPGNRTGGIPGLFGDVKPGMPYYWWEAGAVFGSLIDYWFYTGDAGYNNVTTEAMLWQVGEDQDYNPSNQSRSMGNDDQCFWALSAMSAAEKKFPDPPEDQPQWLALVEAVFNSQTSRWETGTCGGGLHWQVFRFNTGYSYKNTISNGCFFHIGARLARYTGNNTYAEWAEKAYDWLVNVELIAKNTWEIFDGHDSELNCSGGRAMDEVRWSYNSGIILSGAAYMYNYTEGAEKWKATVSGVLNASEHFFTPPGGPKDTLYEPGCEPWGVCNTDQKSFKAYLSRFMALTVKMAPFTADFIMQKLETSAKAAARHCSFGEDQNTCGMKWTLNGKWDNSYGVGEQLSALETIQSNLIVDVAAPVTHNTGGTSKGNPHAGCGKTDKKTQVPATMGDCVGAWLLTAFLLLLLLGASVWIVME